MQISTNILLRYVAAALIAMPLFASAQTQTPSPTTAPVSYPSGVGSCQRTGSASLSSSVGSWTPTGGGPFVPVADFTVELNTGTLVYKECVLREIVNQQRKAATSLITRDVLNKFQYQRNGGPLFPVNMDKDVLQRQDQAVARTLQDNTLTALNDDFEGLVKGGIALDWRADTRAPQIAIACPQSQAELQDYYYARNFSFDGMLAAFEPACVPLSAYYRAQDLVQNDVARDTEEMAFRLETSNGVYGIEKVDQNGNRLTELPGIFVQENTTMALQSGFHQLENADDLNEIIDPLFASLADQVMTVNPTSQAGSGGLARVTGASMSLNGGSASTGGNYLDQMFQNALGGGSSGGGTGTGSNLQGLQSLLQQELEYLNVVTQISQLLIKTKADLNTASNKCWSDTTHSDAAYAQFSSRVVDTAKNVEDSKAAVQGLQAIIISLNSTNPPTTAQISQQLSALKLHSQSQYQQQVQNLSDWSQSMPQFVQTTVDQWLSTNQTNIGCSV